MSGNDAKQKLRVSVLGAGRMGREVIRAVAASDGLQLAGVWLRREGRRADDGIELHGQAADRAVVGTDLDAVLENADVAIDFSLPAATATVLGAVRKARKPLVCGVTGHDESALRQMRSVAESVPVFCERNMSVGIAVLQELVRRAGALLGPEFLAAIHETHHVHKKDAPSGTALKLGEALAKARHRDFDTVFRYSAGGAATRRSANDIVFTVTRLGEVPGEHSVRFQAETETLELTHTVTDRRVFADGALQAARWLVHQKPGLYGMTDILG